MARPTSNNKKLLIVTPAFNESKVISSTLFDLRNLVAPKGWEIEFLVVDDGSIDNTYSLSRLAGFQTIRLPFNCGVGIALRAGFRSAKENDFDAVIQIDADGQHPGDSVSNLLYKLDNENVDIVVGSRFLSGTWSVSPLRKFAMKLLAWMVSSGTGIKITDATSGFRVSGKRAIDFFADFYPGEYLGDTVESLVLAHHEGLLLAEIPVKLKMRQGGQPSHLSVRSALHVFRVIVMVTLILIRPRSMGAS